MISLTNHDFEWGRSEAVIIYPEPFSSLHGLILILAPHYHRTRQVPYLHPKLLLHRPHPRNTSPDTASNKGVCGD